MKKVALIATVLFVGVMVLCYSLVSRRSRPATGRSPLAAARAIESAIASRLPSGTVIDQTLIMKGRDATFLAKLRLPSSASPLWSGPGCPPFCANPSVGELVLDRSNVAPFFVLSLSDVDRSWSDESGNQIIIERGNAGFDYVYIAIAERKRRLSAEIIEQFGP